MFKRLVLVCAAMAMATPAFASRGGAIRIEAKDLKTTESRARVAEKVSLTLRDLGSARLSSEVSRAITEHAGRFDAAKLSRSLESFVEAMRVHNSNKSSNFQLSKVETVAETLLKAAIAVKSNATQNEKTQEMTDLLLSFLGPRLKEKLENESLEYDLNKMQKVAEIILTSDLGRRSIDAREIDALYKELTTLLGSKTLGEVENC